jgi:rhodanese-related sulfurtransferase
MDQVSTPAVWYRYGMLPATSLKDLDFDEALAFVEAGAAFTDLRPTQEYLDVHVPGSLALVYEYGPGMASRARDCLPLSLPLILLGGPEANLLNAAAALRGKGFRVLGHAAEAVNAWVERGRVLASTEVVSGAGAPAGILLDVGDPGTAPTEGAVRIPIERLWTRVDEVGNGSPVVIVAGYGVRAGLAVGMLERSGREEIVLWRRAASLPPSPWQSGSLGHVR